MQGQSSIFPLMPAALSIPYVAIPLVQTLIFQIFIKNDQFLL